MEDELAMATEVNWTLPWLVQETRSAVLVSPSLALARIDLISQLEDRLTDASLGIFSIACARF